MDYMKFMNSKVLFRSAASAAPSIVICLMRLLLLPCCLLKGGVGGEGRGGGHKERSRPCCLCRLLAHHGIVTSCYSNADTKLESFCEATPLAV